MQSCLSNRWLITVACACINLCMPIYTWSVIKGEISKKMEANDPEWDWGAEYLNAPYSLAAFGVGLFAYPVGYCYDKFGPRIVTSVGAVLMFIGLFTCSLSSSLHVWMIAFGFFTSIGFSATYSSQLPTALKWFPPTRAGMVAGIVVSSAGLSPAYLSPFMIYMSSKVGILMAMRYLSVIFFVITIVLAQCLQLPPRAAEAAPRDHEEIVTPGPSFAFLSHTQEDFSFAEAIRTRTLWLSCFGFLLGAGVGLMMIGEGAALANEALGEKAWISLVVLSFGNVGGRVAAGIMNDALGLRKALCFFFSFQAMTMLALIWVPKDSAVGILSVAASIGLNYGAQISSWFVSIKLFYGNKAYGKLFGIYQFSNGLGGVVLSNVGQVLNSRTGTITASAMLGFALLLVGGSVVPFLATPVKKQAAREVSSQLAHSSSANA